MDFGFLAVLILIIAIFIMIVTVVANSVVILAWLFQKSVRSPQNAYLVSLAVVDFLIGGFSLPLVIYYSVTHEWTFGEPLCQVWLISSYSLCTISAFHLIAIAWDRCRAITDGIIYVQKRSYKSVLEVVVLMWVIGIWIIALPLGIDWTNSTLNLENDKKCQTRKSKGFVAHLVFGTYLLPIYFIGRIYFKTYRAIGERLRNRAKVPSMEPSSIFKSDDDTEEKDLKSHSTNNTTDTKVTKTSILRLPFRRLERPVTTNYIHSPSNLHQERIPLEESGNMYTESLQIPSIQIQEFVRSKAKFSLKKERRAAKTLIILVAAFVICWFPYIALSITTALLPDSMRPSPVLFPIVGIIGCANSCVNPIIYSVRHPEFKRFFSRLFCNFAIKARIAM